MLGNKDLKFDINKKTLINEFLKKAMDIESNK